MEKSDTVWAQLRQLLGSAHVPLHSLYLDRRGIGGRDMDKFCEKYIRPVPHRIGFGVY